MNILITAGNTLTPIDKVRCITNIFTGRTGAQLALCAHERGHSVVLLTSHPEVIDDLRQSDQDLTARWNVLRYRTFEDLRDLMGQRIHQVGVDAVIHSAAVSDYLSAGVYAPDSDTCFKENRWESAGVVPKMVDAMAGKVKSDAPELWLRLVRAPKLVDLIRGAWAHRGVLVKFKLEVGVGDERLLEIAEKSRVHSQADLMVANTLEGAGSWAYLGPQEGRYLRVSRRELPEQLLTAVEKLHQERTHG